jgi:type VI secretion system secreted protein Hcp
VAIADMFLKVEGVTGEAGDAKHENEIEVVSWNWALQASVNAATGMAKGKARLSELQVVKRVDQATTTLMGFVNNNKLVKSAKLTVRKAGTTPLEYFTIELEDVRITAVKTESENTELVEHVNLGFSKVKVSYVRQSSTGASGGGTNIFEANALDK